MTLAPLGPACILSSVDGASLRHFSLRSAVPRSSKLDHPGLAKNSKACRPWQARSVERDSVTRKRSHLTPAPLVEPVGFS